jgi:ribosomal protein S18 acetylase RimI-like enzyme
MTHEQGGGAVVTRLEEVTSRVIDALNTLLPQVSTRARPVTAERLDELLRNPSTQILVARLDDEIVGMALLLTLTTLTGRSGYIEEVAVDERARGRGIGTLLIEHVLDRAAAMQLDFVDLTSRSTRVAANRLYRSVGFEVRDTNPYRHRLGGYPSVGSPAP